MASVDELVSSPLKFRLDLPQVFLVDGIPQFADPACLFLSILHHDIGWQGSMKHLLFKDWCQLVSPPLKLHHNLFLGVRVEDTFTLVDIESIGHQHIPRQNPMKHFLKEIRRVFAVKDAWDDCTNVEGVGSFRSWFFLVIKRQQHDPRVFVTRHRASELCPRRRVVNCIVYEGNVPDPLWRSEHKNIVPVAEDLVLQLHPGLACLSVTPAERLLCHSVLRVDSTTCCLKVTSHISPSPHNVGAPS